MDPNITVLSTTGMTSYVYDLPIITYDEGRNTRNKSDKEDDDRKGGNSNGPDSNNNASKSGKD